MSNAKEIQKLHERGFVILQASRRTNAPIGWRQTSKVKKNGKASWGYINEMQDATLSRYRSTFNATLLSRSHCGFYLGHGNLCCIDLDVKKVSDDRADKLVANVLQVLGNQVVIERTKSNGYHIYFLYAERLDNRPNYTGLDAKTANWIELYYSKRFIASYLSNSKKYTKTHGDLATLKALTSKQHKQLLATMKQYEGAIMKISRKSAASAMTVDQDTFNKVESYVQQIEQQQLDVTGDNPQWFKIGKALANAFGDKGFDLFNRLSQYGPTYNADTIADDYARFVSGDNANKSDKKITIASLFKIFEDNGLLSPESLQALQLHPPTDVKEFTLALSKKQRMPEQTHLVVTEFIQHVNICCIDKVNFYVYDTTHWQKRNDKEILDLLFSFIDRSDVKENFRTLLRTVPYFKLMLEELRSITQRDALEPNTGDLTHGIYINLENGVLHVDMKTGKRKLLDHEPSYNFTTLLPFCYEPTQRCPHYDKWIARQVPDRDLQIAYYAFVASCLTRHKADIIMLLAGETSTGKSSLIDITRRLIGIDNCAAISAGSLFSGKPEAQSEAMSMENKLLAYDFDSQPFKHLEMLLKVAAQEPIPGWQMHVARRPVVNYGRVLIAMNPYNYSVFNPAVARRLITVEMNVKIEKDNSVMPLVFDEVAGIFNYVLNIGVRHLLENGGQIRVTDAMRTATVNHHMRERDAVRWYNEKFVKLSAPIKTHKGSLLSKYRAANPELNVIETSIAAMYDNFKTWCELDEGYTSNKIPIRKHFTQDLAAVGISNYVYRNESDKLVLGIIVGSLIDTESKLKKQYGKQKQS